MTARAARRTFLPVVAAALLPGALHAQGSIEVQPPSIDFGEKGQNERPEMTVILRNRGAKPLKVLEIKKSCDCISVSPASLAAPLPVAGTFPLRISMGSGRAMGRLDKWITITTDERGQPEIRIPVRMRVLEDFEMEPRELRFEGAVGGKPEEASVDVRRRRGRPPAPFRLSVTSIKGRFNRPSEKHLQARVAAIPGGQRITVTLDPAHPEGPVSAELEASLDGKALFIPIAGEMFAWIKVSPNYINFSRAIEADPASTVREVVLSSTDGTTFRVLGIDWKPSRDGEKTVRLEFSSAPAGGPLDSPAAVQKVTCRAIRGESVGGGGSFFGTVKIRTDHPKKPEIELRYSGFFAGIEKVAPKK